MTNVGINQEQHMATNAQTQGWAESINVAGVEASGGGGKVDMPKGVYKVKVDSTASVASKKGTGQMNVRFKLSVVEPKHGVGNTLFKTMASPANEKAKGLWKTCLLSIGVPTTTLEKGTVKMSDKTFAGKFAYVSFSPAVDTNGYYDVEFVTPDAYSAAASGAASKKHAGATATANETHEEAEVDDDAGDLL